MIVSALALLFVHAQGPVAELDFELSNNIILAPVTLNGHKTMAVLDSGAGTAVMNLDLAKQWDLATTGDVPVGGIGKEQVHGKFLTDAAVDLAGIKVPVKLAIPLGSMTKLSGRQLVVIIGYEFLKDHIVEVDYSRRHLRIFDAQAEVPVHGVSMPIHIVQNHPHLTTEVTLQGETHSVETMIDTGAAGGGGLSSKYLKSHPVDLPKTPEGPIGGGVGGDVFGSFFRPDSLKIGGIQFSHPLMTLMASSGGAGGPNSAFDLLVGGDVLRRFKLTIDYPHSRMMFEPGSNVNKPFEADKTGLRVYAEGTDFHTFRIAGVMGGSSSAAAGLKVDDVIETIDGKPASDLTVIGLKEEFRSATAKGWDLGIVRGEEHLKIRVEAKSII